MNNAGLVQARSGSESSVQPGCWFCWFCWILIQVSFLSLKLRACLQRSASCSSLNTTLHRRGMNSSAWSEPCLLWALREPRYHIRVPENITYPPTQLRSLRGAQRASPPRLRLRGARRASYPLLLSRARKSRSVIRVKTPFIAGEDTEYTSLLHDTEAAIAASR